MVFGLNGGCWWRFGDHDDAMDGVGHDYHCIQFNQWEMVRDILPTTANDVARIVQMRFAIQHIAERARAVSHLGLLRQSNSAVELLQEHLSVGGRYDDAHAPVAHDLHRGGR